MKKYIKFGLYSIDINQTKFFDAGDSSTVKELIQIARHNNIKNEYNLKFYHYNFFSEMSIIREAGTNKECDAETLKKLVTDLLKMSVGDVIDIRDYYSTKNFCCKLTKIKTIYDITELVDLSSSEEIVISDCDEIC